MGYGEDKLAFGRMLNEAGPHGFITSDECHNYGSVSGCDNQCPVFSRGECRSGFEGVDGEECSHPGCLSHITHPCEGCGRMPTVKEAHHILNPTD